MSTRPRQDRDGDAELLSLFETLALKAGREIMRIFRAGWRVEEKADLSPVTEADRAAEAVILAGLRDRIEGIPCVGEEEAAVGAAPAIGNGAFILVDPLDGTREFIGRDEGFTVNIALVREGVPELGVVYAPARGALYSGRPGLAEAAAVTPGFELAGRHAIRTRVPARPPRIVASRSHRTAETDAFIARFPGAETVAVGSSLKFCLIAAGEADLYPRFGRTMEWDTAAGDAVLRAAGGNTACIDGRPLPYGKCGRDDEADFVNPSFIASGAVLF